MIRRAISDDIPQINVLLNQVLDVHHVGRPDIFKEVGEKYTNEELEELIKNDNNPIFVYEDEEGRILGHCFCQTIDRPERTSTYKYKTLYIDDLCVHEDARKQHIGKALYEYVCDFARKNGYYNITLHAWERNTNAVEFYTHMGMKIQQYTLEEIL